MQGQHQRHSQRPQGDIARFQWASWVFVGSSLEVAGGSDDLQLNGVSHVFLTSKRSNDAVSVPLMNLSRNMHPR